MQAARVASTERTYVPSRLETLDPGDSDYGNATTPAPPSQDGGAVEPLTTRVGWRTSRRGGEAGSSIPPRRGRAADRPSSTVGWATTVIAGSTISIQGTSSKPTSETSSG